MNPRDRIFLFSGLFSAFFWVGCGQPAPVDATLGGFLVHVEPGAGSFLISRLDGTPLVDAFAASQAESGKPPRGLAFRTCDHDGLLEVKDASGTIARVELSARATDARTDVSLFW